MSCEHVFCTWGCQKQARANSKDHSGREGMPDDASLTDLGTPGHELVGGKKIEKLSRIPKIDTRDTELNRAQRRCKSMTMLDSWTKLLNHPSKMFFIIMEGYEKSSAQSVYILCRSREEKLCSCLWTYFLCFSKCVVVPSCISIFFKELVAASERCKWTTTSDRKCQLIFFLCGCF